jgi:RimJ/RimL family protein N-acetyltransferase
LLYNELNLHRVFLKVFTFNERAVKLYEKLGFVTEGKMREALYREGTWHDMMMSILQK